MEDRDRTVDWTKPVGIPDEHPKSKKNVTRACFHREIGRYKNNVPSEFLWAAEDKLVDKGTYEELKCQLPDSPRSTFLMVFSPDGKKVASTHGNHNVYVTDLTTGKNIQTLSGHPRTPWCIAFHPSSNQILASGCLAGQVRVWDLHGGSEVWTTESQSVIASLAFHPVDRMLVIATYNELHFWDWSQSKPFAKCSTKSEKEKVRYVSFDRLGNKLITGIANPVNTTSQWDRVSVVNTQPVVSTTATTSSTVPSNTVTTTSSSLSQGRSVTYCDSYLMNQYSQWVRRYIDSSRSRITRTIDRGTDPMDLVDMQNMGSESESPRTGSSSSASPPNSNRSVRYRVMRSSCRSYRPPSSRERFRIHSSLLSGLPSRSSSSSNSLVRTTTTTTTTSQSIMFTTMATTSSTSSMSSHLFRVRQCGLNLVSGRPVFLTVSRDNLPNLFSMRTSQPSTTHSGAVTNPTYTSYSERGIFSTRETNSGDTDRSRIPLVRPYRILLDDINHLRASVHAVIRSSGEDIGIRNIQEQRVSAISPLDRRDRLRSHMLDVEEVEVDRDLQMSYTTFVSPFRRLSSDSESTSTTPTNAQRPSPQQWVTHNTNHLPLHPRLLPRFQFRPSFDMNNTSPVRRFREDTDSESSTNTTPSVEESSSDPATSHSTNSVLLNTGSVPRLQIRPRYLQDQQSQLQLINNPDTQTSAAHSNQSVRRQFVLSRHSNSPFQPRIPHRIENTTLSNLIVTTTVNSSTSRPEIPSCMSSFVASGTSSTTRTTPSMHLPVGNVASSTSKAVNTATTTIAGDESYVRGNRDLRNRLHFFDHVKLLLRDRIRNSSEHASTDSTVNYSNIANESEGEARNMLDNSLEEGNASTGLGPRGLDPMLSSVSDNSDSANDSQLFPSSGGGPTVNGETSSDLNSSNLEFIVPWESDTDTVPFPSSPPMDPLESDTETVPFRSSPALPEETSHNSQTEVEESGAAAAENGSTSEENTSELSVRQRIQILSLHIENMQRLCRARIEIVQLQQIRKMWEDLTTQIRSLHTAVQSNRNSMPPIEENLSSSSSRNPVNHLERLAISDTSPVPEPSTSQSSETTNENFYSHFKGVIESMVNALLDDKNSTKSETSRAASAKQESSSLQSSETEEPQPGPSGLSNTNLPKRDYFRYRIFKSIRDILNKSKRKRSSDPEGTTQRQNRFRLGDPPRSRFRRHGRHSLDPFLPRISRKDFYSGIESLIQSLETNADDPGPSSETQPSENTSEACQSCGHKSKAGSKGVPKQKRRSTEVTSGSESGGSSSKMMKNSTGGRSVASTSTDTSTPNPPDATSTSELLRKMIERMETMVRFQREAFRRTEELTENNRTRQSESPTLVNSSDDSDSDSLSERQRSVYMRSLSRNNRVTRKELVNLRRSITQYRARRLLDHMVKSLTEFFEENSDNSASVLDDQIISLYTLLHLALELTDLLLDQLNATSQDLERAWGVDEETTSPSETRDTDWLFSDHSRVIRRLRERSRGLTRSSIHPTFGPGREESRRLFPNPFLRSSSRTDTSRLCSNQHLSRSPGNNTSSSLFCRNRPPVTLFPIYRRPRRPTARMSTGPSGWRNIVGSSRRSSSIPRSREGQSSVILPSRISNGDNNSNQFRYFRIWRNSSEEESEQNRNSRSDSNNNTNMNNTSNINNNNDNDTNNNVNNNINNISNNISNTSNNSNINSNSDNSSNNNPTVISGNIQSSNSLPFSTFLNLRDRPMVWIPYGGNSDSNSSSANESQSRENNFTVPVVHVNDIPVQDISLLNQPRYRPQSPTPRVPEDLWRWRAWRPRLLHPRYTGPHFFDDQDSNELPESIHYYRWGPNPGGLYAIDPVIITDAPMSPHHRIQAWDFSKMNIPDISDREANGVVAECKIHNDASVDVSNDGHLLVTLLPSGRFSVTTMLGVYSLDWSSLGQLLYKTSFEQNAVSVSLSPTNRHLLVGLASRPLVVRDRTNMAQIFRLEGARPSPPGGTWQSGRGRLVHMRDLEQTRETNIMSLNCIRWAPGAGQGLVYGTNTGQLKVLR